MSLVTVASLRLLLHGVPVGRG